MANEPKLEEMGKDSDVNFEEKFQLPMTMGISNFFGFPYHPRDDDGEPYVIVDYDKKKQELILLGSQNLAMGKDYIYAYSLDVREFPQIEKLLPIWIELFQEGVEAGQKSAKDFVRNQVDSWLAKL